MESLIMFTNPTSPVAEAYRSLCTNVLAGLGEKKIIEVAGVSEECNSSLIAANLGVAMAQVGKKVLLIDCNLREPKLDEIFGFQFSGITDCIMSGDDFKNYVQATNQANLFLLTAGTIVPNNPIELLLGITMQNILSESKQIYDIVLIDVAPVCGVTDAVALGTKTNGVLLVLVNKQDKVERVQKAKDLFAQARVSILGCVLDKM